MVKRSKWLTHGILFYIRAISEDSLTHFMSHYHDKTMVHNISQITFIDDVAETLQIPEAVVTADVDADSYQLYSKMYMPIQSK